MGIYRQQFRRNEQHSAIVLFIIFRSLVRVNGTGQSMNAATAANSVCYASPVAWFVSWQDRPVFRGFRRLQFAELVGTWTFEGKHYEWVDSVTSKVSLELGGTVVRELIEATVS
jgi:hypothetical protein